MAVGCDGFLHALLTAIQFRTARMTIAGGHRIFEVTGLTRDHGLVTRSLGQLATNAGRRAGYNSAIIRTIGCRCSSGNCSPR